MSHGSILFKNSNYKPATNPIKWYLHSWLIQNESYTVWYTVWLILMSHESWNCFDKLDTKSNLAHPWRAISDQFKPGSDILGFLPLVWKMHPEGPADRRPDPKGLLSQALNRLAISFGLYLFYPFLLEANLKLSKTEFFKIWNYRLLAFRWLMFRWMKRCDELSAYYNTEKQFSIRATADIFNRRARYERPNFENTCSTSRRLRLTCLIFLSICWSRWVELIIIPISARYKSRFVLSFYTRLLYFSNIRGRKYLIYRWRCSPTRNVNVSS